MFMGRRSEIYLKYGVVNVRMFNMYKYVVFNFVSYN